MLEAIQCFLFASRHGAGDDHVGQQVRIVSMELFRDCSEIVSLTERFLHQIEYGEIYQGIEQPIAINECCSQPVSDQGCDLPVVSILQMIMSYSHTRDRIAGPAGKWTLFHGSDQWVDGSIPFALLERLICLDQKQRKAIEISHRNLPGFVQLLPRLWQYWALDLSRGSTI